MAYIDTKHLGKCETCRNLRNGKCNTYCDHGEEYSPNLSKIPTADVVEVKHGEWMPYETEETYGDDGTIWYKCSECGVDALGRCYEDEWYSYPIQSDFCHKCGADLRTPKERGGQT